MEDSFVSNLGELTIKFRRRLNTGDTRDISLTKDGSVDLIWAYGKLSGGVPI